MRRRAAGFVILAVVLAAAAVGRARAQDGANDGRIDFAWTVEAAFPKLGHPIIDKKIQDWAEKNVADRMNEAKDLATADYEDGAWEYWLTYTKSEPSPAAVSVSFEGYTYPKGAAHPSGTMTVLSFATDTGEELGIGDLFQNPDKALEIFSQNAKRLLTDTLRKSAPDAFPAKADLDSLVWFNEGFKPVPENYKCLELAPEGVRVVFQQYQVLPYAFGMPVAVFPLDLLAPAGPSAKIWPK